MKTKIFITILLGLMVVFVNPLNAQLKDKEVTKEIKSRALKEARKEARKLKKQGYKTFPGALVLEKQLERGWRYELIIGENGYSKYLIGVGNAVAETQTAAKVQATAAAKLELAGKIATNVAALIEANLANQQFNTEEAASVTKVVAASKQLIAQELGRVITLVEMYKNIGKNVEINLRIAYDSELAYEAAKKVIRKNLEEQTDILQEKLNKLMNF